MTTKPSFTRSDFVRQRRPGPGKAGSQPVKRPARSPRAYQSRSVLLPGEPRRRTEPRQETRRRTTGTSRQQSYEYSFSVGRTSVRAPALRLPLINFGSPRMISGISSVVLTAILLLLWSASLFTVSGAEVSGNLRLSVDEISLKTGILGEPIFKAVPAQIEANLRTAYPDLSSVQVSARLPNRIVVEVVERTPLIAWFQNGAITWIDTEGMAFMPHGEVSGLVQVASNGSPTDVVYDPSLPVYEQIFINPDMVQAILNLAPYVPDGMLLIYDPEYGIGWQDPRGWDVQIGHDTQDLPLKLTIYQAMVERFINQGIQPTLISMEYLDAPFYK